MTDNSQKTPLNYTLPLLAERRALKMIQLTGKGLPCTVRGVNGSIITVSFNIQSAPYTLHEVTVPMFGPEYIRYPTQVGDKGVVITSDFYIGASSGLGGTVGDMTPQGNLTNLIFLPISNTAWSSVDPNAVTIYGPNGVSLRNTAATSTLIILPAGIALVGETYVRLTCGSCSIYMDATTITITDATAHTSPAIINSAWSAFVSWVNGHTHNDPQGGVTSAPITPFSGGSLAP